MDKFFSPKSIAVIGASRDPKSPGHVAFRNLINSEYRGEVYPVNPKAERILNRKCYTKVSDIKAPVELAVVMVPAKFVAEVIQDCGKKGIRHAVIISAGFGEVGNREGEKKIRQIAKKNKIRFVGVNCMGIYDAHSGMDFIFNPKHRMERPGKGNISFISQSGALGVVILDWMSMKGYNLSKFVSYGNATDIDETDLIEYLEKDRSTKVICAYFEGLKRGRKFFEVAKRIKTPIIAQKGGKTEEGNKAVSSHTGSLAGSTEIYSAAFKQAGVIQANDMEELFDFARIMSTQPKPKGKRVQVITNGGGMGVLLTDDIINNGLELAEISPKSRKGMKKRLPGYFVVKNPIDLTGNATSKEFGIALDAAIKDSNVDMVITVVLFQTPALDANVTEVIAERARACKKPFVVVSAGGRYTEVLKKKIEDAGIPSFSQPQRAARALSVLYNYWRGK